MNNIKQLFTVVTHTVFAALHPGASTAVGRSARTSEAGRHDDRGAVSLEQVLWFVAAGVSVAVIAAIVWNQIRDQANTPINTPSAP
ncbi:MAG: hypothetical protein ABIQ39_09715 [Ilumatobacteraceae bacterium]